MPEVSARSLETVSVADPDARRRSLAYTNIVLYVGCIAHARPTSHGMQTRCCVAVVSPRREMSGSLRERTKPHIPCCQVPVGALTATY